MWIDHFRDRSSPAARQLAHWLAEEPDCIVVNGVVLCELLRCMRSEAAATRLMGALDKLPQAEAVSCADWLLSAGIYRRCRGAGLTIRSSMDCLIAAHAIRLNLPLLAVDRDFDAIATQAPLTLHSSTAV